MELDLEHMTVVVAGLGVSGRSVVDILRLRAKEVIGVDEHKADADLDSFDAIPWERVDLVCTSPVFDPRTPFILEARRRGIPVVSEVEIAWLMRVDNART
ncbi:MAG: UDP-N-acetylmuramoyl-L-alanine--D-glutamate ligase, partial [Bifidobacterium castoris]|nr:UDP-N-acetylmuramoyl-L-alanine--D-glutamate ligase [Bifidobacterium castoris]